MSPPPTRDSPLAIERRALRKLWQDKGNIAEARSVGASHTIDSTFSSDAMFIIPQELDLSQVETPLHTPARYPISDDTPLQYKIPNSDAILVSTIVDFSSIQTPLYTPVHEGKQNQNHPNDNLMSHGARDIH
jgi:hypothetical protein